jgi:YfiH family protein
MTKILNPQVSKPLFYEDASFAAAVPGLFHGFFTRRGGVSAGVYTTLNCGPGSNDAAGLVQRNRAIVAQTAGCTPENLLSLYQFHSAECVVARQSWGTDRPKGDAMVTDVPGLALGVLTADCAPVLFHGQKADSAPVIGAAHAGWGGALKGVLENTAAEMVALGAQPASIKAAVGPCIAQASYEVQEAFATPFYAQDEESEKFFKSARKAGHLMFDLAGYCAFRLAKAGVQDVSISDLDTYAHEADFFSYRRTTHRGEADYGRQISVIAILSH